MLKPARVNVMLARLRGVMAIGCLLTPASACDLLAGWLYALCWTGTDRPGELFNRATTWLLTHKVLLPGVTVLERFIAQLCSRVEERLWLPLCRSVTDEQTQHLQELLVVVEGNHYSRLDQLGSGPVMISGPALIRASR